jgi:hypothetical protein
MCNDNLKCTHYEWENEVTCYLLTGNIRGADAVSRDYDITCGITRLMPGNCFILFDLKKKPIKV